jgi:hypothetical protein
MARRARNYFSDGRSRTGWHKGSSFRGIRSKTYRSPSSRTRTYKPPKLKLPKAPKATRSRTYKVGRTRGYKSSGGYKLGKSLMKAGAIGVAVAAMATNNSAASSLPRDGSETAKSFGAALCALAAIFYFLGFIGSGGATGALVGALFFGGLTVALLRKRKDGRFDMVSRAQQIDAEIGAEGARLAQAGAACAEQGDMAGFIALRPDAQALVAKVEAGRAEMLAFPGLSPEAIAAVNEGFDDLRAKAEQLLAAIDSAKDEPAADTVEPQPVEGDVNAPATPVLKPVVVSRFTEKSETYKAIAARDGKARADKLKDYYSVEGVDYPRASILSVDAASGEVERSGDDFSLIDTSSRILEAQHHRCANPFCGRKLSYGGRDEDTKNAHVVLIVPFGRGGRQTMNNLHALCRNCCQMVGRNPEAGWMVLLYAQAQAHRLNGAEALHTTGRWIADRIAAGLGAPTSDAMGYMPKNGKVKVTVVANDQIEGPCRNQIALAAE